MATNTKAPTMSEAKNVYKKRSFKDSAIVSFIRSLSKNKLSLAGFCFIIFMILVAVCAPYICKYSYTKLDMLNSFQLPNSDHWLGTDELGRDLFARIIYGARYSLAIAFISEVVALAIGVLLGATAGYFSGVIGDIILRFCDILQAIPHTLLAIVISQALGAGFMSTVFALAISSITGTVRLQRALILNIREQEYVEAGKAITASNARIIFRHVLPNTIPQLIISFTGGLSGKLIMVAGLSYLGLGVQPPTPEWGALLSEGRQWIQYYPHVVMYPGLFILLTALAFNLLGDGVRDALDPRLRD